MSGDFDDLPVSEIHLTKEEWTDRKTKTLDFLSGNGHQQRNKSKVADKCLRWQHIWSVSRRQRTRQTTSWLASQPARYYLSIFVAFDLVFEWFHLVDVLLISIYCDFASFCFLTHAHNYIRVYIGSSNVFCIHMIPGPSPHSNWRPNKKPLCQCFRLYYSSGNSIKIVS